MKLMEYLAEIASYFEKTKTSLKEITEKIPGPYIPPESYS